MYTWKIYMIVTSLIQKSQISSDYFKSWVLWMKAIMSTFYQHIHNNTNFVVQTPKSMPVDHKPMFINKTPNALISTQKKYSALNLGFSDVCLWSLTYKWEEDHENCSNFCRPSASHLCYINSMHIFCQRSGTSTWPPKSGQYTTKPFQCNSSANNSRCWRS